MDKFELGKLFTHETDKNIVYVVVGRSVKNAAILQRQDGRYEPFTITKPDTFVEYTPPPPNVKVYYNCYVTCNEQYLGGCYGSLDRATKESTGCNATDRIEVEFTHDGKFVSARSVM